MQIGAVPQFLCVHVVCDCDYATASGVSTAVTLHCALQRAAAVALQLLLQPLTDSTYAVTDRYFDSELELQLKLHRVTVIQPLVKPLVNRCVT